MATKTPATATPPVPQVKATHTVKALVPVDYDQVRHEPDDIFEVRSEALGQLLSGQSVELVVADMPELPAA